MEDKITIPLSAKQRDLLLKYQSYFADHDLFRLISIAVKKDKTYEIYMDEQQLEDLLDQISGLCNHEEDEKLQGDLDDLCEYMGCFYDEFGDNDYSEKSSNVGSVCVLKVSLVYSNEIWRKIAIREGQTLHDLNNIIFDAFDRYDDHMYSFFVPHSRKKFNPRTIRKSSDEFTHPYVCEDQEIYGGDSQDASLTSIENLDLSEKQKFYYLFDFGDMWWHEITVENTDGTADDEKYPRIIEREGQSPEQYEYPDEEDDD